MPRRGRAPAYKGRSELGGRTGRSTRPGIATARVSQFGNTSTIRAVQTYNKAGGIAPKGFRAPRKVVTRISYNRRTGRSVTSLRTVTGPRGLGLRRQAIFISKGNRMVGQRTAALGAYAHMSRRPKTRRALNAKIKAAGYRKSVVRTAMLNNAVPVYVQRRQSSPITKNRVAGGRRRPPRTRRDSKGRYAGSYAG